MMMDIRLSNVRRRLGILAGAWAIASLLAGAWAIASLAGIPVAAWADVPATQKPEVTHLLEFIRTSPCRFVRNGREYGGERAHRHVLRKYDYFRDEITTTEEFVEFSASTSTSTGEPYEFRCDGETPQESRDVLLGELRRYRSSSG